MPADPLTWQNAAVLVDKPLSWTSFDVCGKLRGALRIKKVGHAGTLDPQASGLLIICIGKGCKKVDCFVAMEKVYTGTLRLGEATPSFDAETDVSERRPWQHLSEADLAAARDSFLGDTMQLPPMYSAISVKGQRLYLAARAGETVERQHRAISVSRFDLWRDKPGAQDVHFRVTCSKGTYIRALAHDLGQAVGSAAHLVALRRESIGEHCVSDAWQLADLVAAIHEQREALGVPKGAPISSVANQQ